MTRQKKQKLRTQTDDFCVQCSSFLLENFQQRKLLKKKLLFTFPSFWFTVYNSMHCWTNILRILFKEKKVLLMPKQFRPKQPATKLKNLNFVYLVCKQFDTFQIENFNEMIS